MSNNVLENLIKQKDYIFKTQIFKLTKDFDLNVNELLLIIYFTNNEDSVFDIKIIREKTFLKEEQIMDAISSLTKKNLFSLNTKKDKNGIINEVIELSNLYKLIANDLNENTKQKTNINLFNIFEKEFGRTLSPIEFEIINAWLKSGMNEEIIIGALKEATYNGVSNLRYIDKIIYEWNKKGFKTMKDVKGHINSKDKSDTKELFDYNWLDDE